MQPEYVKMPSYEEEWLAVSKDFEEIWNFPNCVGAIDGKHIVTQAPRNAGCMFFDFKGTHSIILLAVCDARYRFLVVDLWGAGHHSDSKVFSSFPLGKALDSNLLSLPRFLRTRKSSVYYPTGVVDVENSNGDVAQGSWRDAKTQGLKPIHSVGSNQYFLTAATI